jgi:hypothetical protein
MWSSDTLAHDKPRRRYAWYLGSRPKPRAKARVSAAIYPDFFAFREAAMP